MKYLCTICARGGSKGVPGKNIRKLAGLPLIAHSIAQAKASKLFSHIAVSSDSDEILSISKAHGADILVKRPDILATDESGKMPAIAHAVQSVEKETGATYDIVVDLAATSPLRSAQDIIAAVELQKKTGCSSVITGTPARRSPYFDLVEGEGGGVVRLSKARPNEVLRRQDGPQCFDMNGSIYVWKRDALLKNPSVFYDDTRLYVMPRERSIDIDEELDLEMAEFMLRRAK